MHTANSLIAPLASFFLEGLTIVCVVGTILLWVVFGFLFFVERSAKKDQQISPASRSGAEAAKSVSSTFPDSTRSGRGR